MFSLVKVFTQHNHIIIKRKSNLTGAGYELTSLFICPFMG